VKREGKGKEFHHLTAWLSMPLLIGSKTHELKRGALLAPEEKKEKNVILSEELSSHGTTTEKKSLSCNGRERKEAYDHQGTINSLSRVIRSSSWKRGK